MSGLQHEKRSVHVPACFEGLRDTSMRYSHCDESLSCKHQMLTYQGEDGTQAAPDLCTKNLDVACYISLHPRLQHAIRLQQQRQGGRSEERLARMSYVPRLLMIWILRFYGERPA